MLSGTVTNEKGDPLVNVTITLPYPKQHNKLIVVGGKDSTFEFLVLPPGNNYTLSNGDKFTELLPL